MCCVCVCVCVCVFIQCILYRQYKYEMLLPRSSGEKSGMKTRVCLLIG